MASNYGPLLRGSSVAMVRAQAGAKPVAGVEMSDIDVRFFDPSQAPVEAPVPVPAAAERLPTNLRDAEIKAWDPLHELNPQVADPPDYPLPSDGVVYNVDKDGRVTGRHAADDERPNAPYGRAYFAELLQRRLEQEANQVYKFAKLLDGNLQGRSRAAQALSSVWLSNNPGGSAISMIFQNLLNDVTAGGGGRAVGALVDPGEILPSARKHLLAGLDDAAGSQATEALGITTEAGRVAAAQAVDGSREKAMQFAEHAVKISNAAKDLPDTLAGSLVREVIGLGNAALASPAVAAGVTIVPLVDIGPPGVAPPPAAAVPKIAAPPAAPKGGAIPVPPAMIAVPKGVGDRLVDKDRGQVALELASRQIVNADFQLYRIMNDNPTEAKLKAWDLLYFNGSRYIRPKSVASLAKDLEALRVITKILNDTKGSSSGRDSSANALIASYQATENTGMLFIDDTARAAILRAYDKIRYTHGNQRVPLISFMTQETVQSRFAEFVAWVYHAPPGAATPRGSSVSGASRYDQDMHLIGKWLAACDYCNGILVPPGYDALQVAVRYDREKRIADHVETHGAYPTGDPRMDRPRKIRTNGDLAAAREEEARRARAVAYLAGGSL